MVFSKPLRERIRRGLIRCTVRVWQQPRVKVGGKYKMDDGHVVIDSIEAIVADDVTDRLARESGFPTAKALMTVARHGAGEHIYLVRFHYLPPGAWTRTPTPPV